MERDGARKNGMMSRDDADAILWNMIDRNKMEMEIDMRQRWK